MIKPLDVIQLRVAVDAWDAGTVATVLEASPDRVLAEIADDDGRTLDVISVPVDAATRIDCDNGAGHLRTFLGAQPPQRQESPRSRGHLRTSWDAGGRMTRRRAL